jgi:hypothetical protein
VPSWLDRGAELAGYPWATGAEMACCTLLQILLRYNKVPSWRPPVGPPGQQLIIKMNLNFSSI